jgi:hypothetical protein
MGAALVDDEGNATSAGIVVVDGNAIDDATGSSIEAGDAIDTGEAIDAADGIVTDTGAATDTGIAIDDGASCANANDADAASAPTISARRGTEGRSMPGSLMGGVGGELGRCVLNERQAVANASVSSSR